MRAGFRIAIALTASALLHVAWLAIPSHARTGQRPRLPGAFTVQIAKLPVPRIKIGRLTPPPKQKPPPPPPAEPVAATPPQPSPAPDWVRDITPETDTTYYSTPELDTPSYPLENIDIPDEPTAQLQRGRAVLEVHIDSSGAVADVIVLEVQPPDLKLDTAIAAFRHATFTGAIRDGRFVNSRKAIEICFGPCPKPDPNAPALPTPGSADPGTPAIQVGTPTPTP